MAYLPPKNDVVLFEKGRVPWLLGTGTKRGPEDFHLIAFSNSIVQEMLNIPWFLKTSGIPLKRSERIERRDLPLIILGGSNSIYTTSFWGDDSPIDGVFTGTAVRDIKRLLEISAAGHKNNLSKTEIILAMESVPGFYPTAEPKKRLKTTAETYGEGIFLERGPVLYNEEEIGSGYLEISRGCRALCSFCSENWTRKPYREAERSFLLKEALKMKAEMGLERIALFSFNFNMYTAFYGLLRGCSRIFTNVALKSQRFDMLAGEDNILEYQREAGKTVYSCGLEGISARLRRYLNKNLDDEALYKSIELIFKVQARELKVFLLSTGKEEEEDFKEFSGLLARVGDLKKKHKARTRVVFSITPLVRFPWTPLEFDDAYLPEKHEGIISRTRKLAEGRGFEARVAMDIREYMVSQILVRASDRLVMEALFQAIWETKFIYYINISNEFYSSFKRHLAGRGLSSEGLLKGHSLEESLKKPWAVMDTGVDRETLWEAFRKNLDFEEIGALFEKMKPDKPSFTVGEYHDELARLKANGEKRDFYVTVGGRARGLPRKYFGIVLARAIMKADAGLVEYFRSYSASAWDKKPGAPVWIAGDDIISLIWDKKAGSLLEKIDSSQAFRDAVNRDLGEWGVLRGNKDAKSSVTVEIIIDSPFAFSGATYFKKRGLKYTSYGKGRGEYRFEFTETSLKKKIMSQCVLTAKNAGSGENLPEVSLLIMPGGKFDLEEFLKEAFVLPGKNDWVRISVISTMMFV